MLNRGGAEMRRDNQLTEKIIGCAIEVHKALGPGLLESAYEECFCYELAQNGFSVSRQVPLPVSYRVVLNFIVPALKDGIKRLVNKFQDASASRR